MLWPHDFAMGHQGSPLLLLVVLIVGRWVIHRMSRIFSSVARSCILVVHGPRQEAYILNLSPWRNLIFGCANPNSVDPERIKMILTMLSPGFSRIPGGSLRCSQNGALFQWGGAPFYGDRGFIGLIPWSTLCF